MTIFVTGGTGYLGTALVKELSKKSRLHLLVERGTEASLPKSKNITVFYGDIREPASVGRAMKGCSIVFHLAALFTVKAEKRLFEEINVGGFVNVAEAALKNKVKRFIYTSSIMALGPTDECRGKIGDESKTHAPNSFSHDYERTKYLALVKADEYAKKGLPIVTLVPGAYIGRGRTTHGSRFNQFISNFLTQSTLLIPGKRGNLYNFVLTEDVVRAQLLALREGKAGEKYIIGGKNVSFDQLYDDLERIKKIKRMRIYVPFWLLKSLAWAEEIRAAVFRQEPLTSLGEIRSLEHSWAVSSNKAMRELGYKPTPWEQTLRRTCNWLEKEAI